MDFILNCSFSCETGAVVTNGLLWQVLFSVKTSCLRGSKRTAAELDGRRLRCCHDDAPVNGAHTQSHAALFG